MDNWTIFIALFCGIAIAQAIFLAAFLLVKDRLKTASTIFLALMLTGLAFRLSKSYFFYVFEGVPHWVVNFGAAGLWAMGPSLWLYTKSSHPKKIQPTEYLHYLPSLLCILAVVLVDTRWIIKMYYGGSVVLTLYLIGSLVRFKHSEWSGNPNRFWLFFWGMAMIWLTFIFQMLSPSIQLYTIGSAVASLVLYAVNFMIMQNQQLFKIKGKDPKRPNKAVQEDIARELEALFGEQKMHLQKGLTVAAVAKAIQKPTYLISQTIRHHYGLKFTDFVNKFRVQEVKNQLADQANPTIESIALQSGFSSTSSLYQAFKREENLTPQAYRKQLIQARGIASK